MKRIINLNLMLALVIVSMAAFTWTRADKYVLDVEKSKIIWQGGRVVGGDHKGEIPFKSGSFLVESEALKGGEFVADVNAIKVTDVEGSGAERLTNHLKNEDFFETEKYPNAGFKITKVAYTGKDQATVTGDLTIKDVTKSITFPATVHTSAQQVHAVAKGIKIDRTQYNVKYRSGNFFSGLGDRAINDEFTLDIEILAKK